MINPHELDALEMAALFRPWKLPPIEQKAGQSVFHAISGLTNFIRGFEETVSLFAYARNQKLAEDQRTITAVKTGLLPPQDNRWQFFSWQMIAARSGALMLYHFVESVRLMNKGLGGCPSLRDGLDTAKLKTANQILDQHFTKYIRVRHGVGHSAEFTIKGKSTIAGPHSSDGIEIGHGASLVLGESLSGETFSTTFENIVVSYDVNAETSSQMKLLAAAIYEAFAPAVRPFR